MLCRDGDVTWAGLKPMEALHSRERASGGKRSRRQQNRPVVPIIYRSRIRLQEP
jgi:hypothetical protein